MTRKAAAPETVDLDATRQRLDRLGLLHAAEQLDAVARSPPTARGRWHGRLRHRDRGF